MKLFVTTAIAALTAFSVSAASLGVQAITSDGQPIGEPDVTHVEGLSCDLVISYVRDSMPESVWVEVKRNQYIVYEDNSYALVVCIEDGVKV